MILPGVSRACFGRYTIVLTYIFIVEIQHNFEGKIILKAFEHLLLFLEVFFFFYFICFASEKVISYYKVLTSVHFPVPNWYIVYIQCMYRCRIIFHTYFRRTQDQAGITIIGDSLDLNLNNWSVFLRDTRNKQSI